MLGDDIYQIPKLIKSDVLKRLSDLELKYNIKIIFAIESGSRAWGFASQDSDYDVRFIYMHGPEWYLNIVEQYAEIENNGAINLPINDDLDVAGWDLKKALGLMLKSNPPLIEWLHSPIVYRQDSPVTRRLQKLAAQYYSPKSCIHHYLHMAKGNFNQYLNNKDEVLHKKYLYVIRPILACRWIESRNNIAPMEIDKVMVTIDNHPIKSEIEALVAKKRAGSELSLGPPIKSLNDFLSSEIIRLEETAKKFEPPNHDMNEINKSFREILGFSC